MRFSCEDKLADEFGSNEIFQTFGFDLEAKILEEFETPSIFQYRYTEPSPQAVTFCKNLYVQDKNDFSVTNATLSLKKEKIKLTHQAQNVLAFASSPRQFREDEVLTSHRVFVLKGPSGIGKSTFIKFLLFYVYPSSEELKAQFLPVYINARTNESNIRNQQSSQIKQFLFSQIKKFFFIHMAKVCLNTPNDERFANWVLEENCQSEQLGRLASISAKRDAIIRRCFELVEEAPDILFKDLLAFYNEHVKPVVIVLDGLDHFTLGDYRETFSAINELKGENLRVLIVVRDSTYSKLDSARIQIIDTKRTYGISHAKLCEVMEKRIINSRKLVSARNPKKDLTITAETKSAVETLFSLILSKRILDFLIRTSNSNLKTIGIKLEWILKSTYLKLNAFSLLKQDLNRTLTGKMTCHLPHSAIYSAVITNRYVGYYEDEQNTKTGIVNLFQNGKCSINPYNHFIRLNLLAYAYYSMGPNENGWFTWKDLNEDILFVYKDVLPAGIGEKALVNGSAQALLTLIRSHLIHSPEALIYDCYTDIIENPKHFFKISDSGEFYLTSVIPLAEYVFFMKDCIDWPDSTHARLIDDHCVSGSCKLGELDRLRSAFLAIRELMKEEMQILASLSLSNPDKASSPFTVYEERFSAKVLAPMSNNYLFLEWICQKIEKYLAVKRPHLLKDSRIIPIRKEIEKMRREHSARFHRSILN